MYRMDMAYYYYYYYIVEAYLAHNFVYKFIVFFEIKLKLKLN